MNIFPKYNLINFALLYWSDQWKRNQSMIFQIANFDFIERVYYINPETWFGEIFQKEKYLARRFFYKKKNIYVLTFFHFPFFGRYKFGLRLETNFYLFLIKKILLKKPFIIFFNRPILNQPRLLDLLLSRCSLSIFDMSDDFLEFYNKNNKFVDEKVRNFIKKYLPRFDVVFAVNRNVHKKYKSLNRNIYVIPNAVNIENFKENSNCLIPEIFGYLSKPILVYTGTINSIRIDYDLLDKLEKKYNLLFIGFPDEQFLEWASTKTNVFLYPPVPQKELKSFLEFSDVAIVPFKVNEHTKGNDLLKVYEYLACGKPVVLTNILSKRINHSLIKYCSSHEEFLYWINNFSNYNVSISDRKSMLNLAQKNSWNVRALLIKKIIKIKLGICQ